MLEKPPEGSRWRHRKGAVYTVLGVTSDPEPEKAGKFPVTVFYEGPGGFRWARTLESWHRSFVPED
jgi:hypothetical protein